MGFYAPSFSYIDRTDMQVSLEFWAQEIAVAMHLVKAAPVRIFNDIKDMALAFNQDELDLIVAPPLEMAIYFKREKMSAGFVAVEQDKRANAVLLLVRKDKHIQAASDLRNKRLLLVANNYLSEVVLDNYLLKNLQQNFSAVFSNVKRIEQQNLLVLDLFFDQADVAVVYESVYRKMVELNPQIADKLEILHSYPVAARNFSFFRRDYPYIEQMTNIAVNLRTPRMQQILNVFQTESVHACTVDALAPYDSLYQEYQSLVKLANLKQGKLAKKMVASK